MYIVAERLSGDFDNHLAVIETFKSKEPALARRRAIINARTAPDAPFGAVPLAYVTKAIQVWRWVA